VFTVRERERVRRALLELARADPEVTGAAHVGSYVDGGGDRWSDIDINLGIRGGGLKPALARWTGWLYDGFSARHHWDLPAGAAVYRVFLLPGWLEVDLGFRPETDFGPKGPHWETVFGEAVPAAPTPVSDVDDLLGHAWHHLRLARVGIERGRAWQALHWINGTRDQVIALAASRLGLPALHAKGAHLLPPELTDPLKATLATGLDEPSLRQAWDHLAEALAAEASRHGADWLAAELRDF
jgi:hypothetical protein